MPTNYAVAGQAVAANPSLQKIYAIIEAALTYVAVLVGISIWEMFSMLPKEIDLVWRSRPSIVKYIYLFCRYWTLASLTAFLVIFSLPIRHETCQKFSFIEPLFTLLATLSVEAILACRVISVWTNDRRVIAICIALLLLDVGSMLSGTITNEAAQLPPGAIGCTSTTPKEGSVAPMSLFFGATVFADLVFLGLMVYKSVSLWRITVCYGSLSRILTCQGSKIPLLQTLVRDQCALYAVTASVALLNLVTFVQRVNVPLQPIHASLNHALPALFACRMVLNLRAQAREGKLSIEHSAGFTGITTGVKSPAGATIGSSMPAFAGQRIELGNLRAGPFDIEKAPTPIHITTERFVDVDQASRASVA